VYSLRGDRHRLLDSSQHAHSHSYTSDTSNDLVSTLQNISICSQSSTMDEHRCGLALDGNIGTFAMTLEHRGRWPWYELDMGTMTYVAYVKIWIASLSTQSNNAPLMLTATNSSIIGVSKNHARDLLSMAFSANVNASFKHSVEVTIGRTARFLVIQRRDVGVLAIAEIQLLGRQTCGNGTCVHGLCQRVNSSHETCACDPGYMGPTCSQVNPSFRPPSSDQPPSVSDCFRVSLMYLEYPTRLTPSPQIVWLAAATAFGSLGTCFLALLFRIMCSSQVPGSKEVEQVRAIIRSKNKKSSSTSKHIMMAPLLRRHQGHEPAIAFMFASPKVHCRPVFSQGNASGRLSNGSQERVVLTPLTQLDIAAESDRLLHTVHRSSIPVHLDAIPLTEVSLRCILSQGMHEVIHLSCHCHGSSLIMEDEDGAAHIMDADALNRIFQINSGLNNLRVLLLNGCGSSQVASSLTIEGCAVIATKDRVTDEAALKFTHHFYLSLLCAQKNIDDAFIIARDALSGSSSYGENFVLLSSSRSNVQRRAFRNHGVGDFSSSRRPPSNRSRVPLPPDDKIEKSSDVYRVIQALRHRRVMVIRGLGGIGKSTVASEVARFISLRRSCPSPDCFYSDGVLWVPLPSHKSVTAAEVIRRLKVVTEGHASFDVELTQENPGTTDDQVAAFDRSCKYDSLCEDVVASMKKSKFLKGVIIIDQCDEVVTSQEFYSCLSYLLHELPHVRVLLTSRMSPFSTHVAPDGYDCYFRPIEISIAPLTSTESARLFLHRAQRSITLEEVLEIVDPCVLAPQSCNKEKERSKSPDIVLEETLAKTRVIAALCGHPLRISQVAATVASPQRKLSDVDTELENFSPSNGGN